MYIYISILGALGYAGPSKSEECPTSDFLGMLRVGLFLCRPAARLPGPVLSRLPHLVADVEQGVAVLGKRPRLVLHPFSALAADFVRARAFLRLWLRPAESLALKEADPLATVARLVSDLRKKHIFVGLHGNRTGA